MMLNIRRFLLLLGLVALPYTALGADSPFDFVMMSLGGTLAQSSDGKVTPSDGDIVSAVNDSTKQVVGQGIYSGAAGTYELLLTPPSSSNGINISLRINHANKTYELFKTGSNDSIIKLIGVPFPGPPPRDIVPVMIGTEVGSGSGTPPPPATPLAGDINGDGKVDDADIQALKDAISGGGAIDKKTMDVNGDGVVNTRDLIDAIRAARTQSTTAPASIRPAPVSIRPAPASIRP